jgi:hypothetical protein
MSMQGPNHAEGSTDLITAFQTHQGSNATCIERTQESG